MTLPLRKMVKPRLGTAMILPLAPHSLFHLAARVTLRGRKSGSDGASEFSGVYLSDRIEKLLVPRKGYSIPPVRARLFGADVVIDRSWPIVLV